MEDNQLNEEPQQITYREACTKLEAALARMTIKERAVYEQRLRQLVALRSF